MAAYADTEDPIALLNRAPDTSGGPKVADAISEAGIEVQAVNWVWQKVVGSDLVSSIIEPITGDFEKISEQASQWENVCDALQAVRNNLNSGLGELDPAWNGDAADSFKKLISTEWTVSVEADAQAAKLIGIALNKVADGSRKACDQALNLIKKLVDKLIEAAAMLPIPVVGWARAVKLVYDGVQIYNAIMQLIEGIKQIIQGAQQVISGIQQVGSALGKLRDVNSLNDLINVGNEAGSGLTQVKQGADAVRDGAGDVRSGASDATSAAHSAHSNATSGGGGGGSGSGDGGSGSTGGSGDGGGTSPSGTGDGGGTSPAGTHTSPSGSTTTAGAHGDGGTSTRGGTGDPPAATGTPPAGGTGGGGDDTPPRSPHGPAGSGGDPDLPRRPEDRSQPHPELNSSERDALNARHERLRNENPEDFENLRRDQDNGNKILPKTDYEAQAAQGLKEDGRLPADAGRPQGDERGDFVTRDADGNVTATYEHKGLHTDYPDWSTQRDQSVPFQGSYHNNPDAFTNKIETIVADGQHSVIDTRNADQAAIDDLKRRIDEKGWSGRVIWYP